MSFQKITPLAAGEPTRLGWASAVRENLEYLYGLDAANQASDGNLSFEEGATGWEISGPYEEITSGVRGGKALRLTPGATSQSTAKSKKIAIPGGRPTRLRFAIRHGASAEISVIYYSMPTGEALVTESRSWVAPKPAGASWTYVQHYLKAVPKNARYVELVLGSGTVGSADFDDFSLQMADPTYPWVIVAASNSPIEMKAFADYVCPGGADDDAGTIQKAIDEVFDASYGKGGRVILAKGEYRLKTPTFTPKDEPGYYLALRDGIKLVGAGNSTRLLVVEGFNEENNAEMYAFGGIGTKNAELSDLAIERTGASAPRCGAVWVKDTQHVKLDCLKTKGLNERAIVYLSNSKWASIERCVLETTTDNGRIEKIIDADNGAYNRIEGCHLLGVKGEALNLAGAIYCSVAGNTVNGKIAGQRSGAYGVRLDDSGGTVSIANQIQNNTITGLESTAQTAIPSLPT